MEARRGKGFDWEGLEEALRSGLGGIIGEIRKPELALDYKMRLTWDWLGMVFLKLIEAIGESDQDVG